MYHHHLLNLTCLRMHQCHCRRWSWGVVSVWPWSSCCFSSWFITSSGWNCCSSIVPGSAPTSDTQVSSRSHFSLYTYKDETLFFSFSVNIVLSLHFIRQIQTKYEYILSVFVLSCGWESQVKQQVQVLLSQLLELRTKQGRTILRGNWKCPDVFAISPAPLRSLVLSGDCLWLAAVTAFRLLNLVPVKQEKV